MPTAPGKPDIIDYDNQSVTLKWTHPEKDGGRPITHYIVEVKSKFSPDWNEVFKTEGDVCEAYVDQLKENMTYQFRVKAYNKAGQSPFSEPTDNHLCKYKNRKYCSFLFVANTMWVMNFFNTFTAKITENQSYCYFG